MEFLIYLIKVNIAVILMYGFYGLLFRNDTFFRWKRMFLLSIPVIALLYPLIDMSQLLNYEMASNNKIFPGYYLNEVIVTAGQGQSGSRFSFTDFLLGIYLLGVSVLFIRITAQMVSVFFLLIHTQKMQIDGRKIYRKEGLQTPFSFFRYIVLDPQKYATDELREIIRHEETHVRQYHSLDVMTAELMTAFCWFNPFIRLVKREIRMNLEYLADHSVIDSGLSREHYQFHLLRLTSHKAAATITNNFNVSPLKKRIFMMNKKETPRLGMVKYLLVLPVIAALLIFNQYDTNAQDKVTTEATGKIMITSKEVYAHVEQMPQFPGGEAELLKWLGQNIIYPISAAEKGIQGRVVVRYVIRADGSIDSVKVVRSLNPECDAEAVRAIQAMPKWIPGKQNGEPVDVYYNLPVQFKLSGGPDEPTSPVLKSNETVSTVVEIDGKVVSEEEWKNADPTKLELQIMGKLENPTRMMMIFKTKK